MDLQTAIETLVAAAIREKAEFSAYNITRSLNTLVEEKVVGLPPNKTTINHPETRTALKVLHQAAKMPGYASGYTQKDGSVFLLYTPKKGTAVEYKSVCEKILDSLRNPQSIAVPVTPALQAPATTQTSTTPPPPPAILPKAAPKSRPKKAACLPPLQTPPPTSTTGATPVPTIPVPAATTAKPSAPNTGQTIPKEEIVEEVRLIFSDVVGNNNKVWYGALLKNRDVYTEWGRVGKNMQTKTYPRAGADKLWEKEREKRNKGYTPAQIISHAQKGTSQPVHNHNLEQIAINQISKGEPVLTRLVTQLVRANIHKITHQSKITYNDSTGLFQTPLGVVTLQAIQDAYRLLQGIQTARQAGELETRTNLDRINQYLRLIPQDFGMRLNAQIMFPDDQAIQKQQDLLDALEASYRMLTSPQKKAQDGNTNEPEEKLFEITVNTASAKETERIRALYRKTRQNMHRHVAGMDVKQAYELHVPIQHQAFNAYGAKLDNIWELWHGTKNANVLNILRTGLQVAPPSTAAIAGKMFGNGVYFSDQSTKSLNYATDFWHGGGRGSADNMFMFLASVAMGRYNVPSGQRYSPPPKGYDSYFAKAGQSGVHNNEMIVFREDQFELVRLVEFSERGK
jgi:poly [ADP-ribose] polymerase 2/3/4